MAFGEKLYHVWSQSRLPSSMSICLLAEATKKEHTKAESDLEMSKRGEDGSLMRSCLLKEDLPR
jgi:hypothetical protein